jgi:hypothetical protein
MFDLGTPGNQKYSTKEDLSCTIDQGQADPTSA